MSQNTAAWQTASRAKTYETKEAPYPSPKEHEIVVKTAAVAINPVDWFIQQVGDDRFGFLQYPTILGSDVAGEVVQVGSAVTRFSPGDRVLGLAAFFNCGPTHGAFQSFVLLDDHLSAKMPESISYESACVVPLGTSTAACGLFQKGFLGLQHPKATKPTPSGKTVLIWSAATSVGSNAVQLAVAAGYEVFATTSPKNFEYVQGLGASKVFDYRSDTVVAEIIEAFQGKSSAGALACVGDGTVPCARVVDKVGGVKSVATVKQPSGDIPEGVEAKFIFGSSLRDDEVGPAVFVDFLPQALAEGSFICTPPAEVVGKGIGAIQDALEVQKKGVSAKKIVVTM
ncbi:hypothetical protein AAFC00_003955 [Neodothiora populina]|uniref:Enoyl reductase (ER) domain-containing protein n=1 Tax=Neodothiora populina TaxID=2781224 RepID=A0ABR3PI15_9PEZI